MNEENKRIEELNELLIGEEEIMKELNKPGGLEKGYKIYYLLDNNWVEKYKSLIINNNMKKCKNLLNVSFIKGKTDKKDFTYIHKNFKFTFSYNFTLVTQNFMDLLCKNFIIDEQKKFQNCSYRIIIGGKCFIIRDQYNENSTYACITLYNEKNKKFNNNIDYFLIIHDRKEMNKYLDYILKNNIWNYFKKINYSYKDEYKKIKNTEGRTIGYLILNNENIMQLGLIDNRNNNYLNKNNGKTIEINERSRDKIKSMNFKMNGLNTPHNNSNRINKNSKSPFPIKNKVNLLNNNNNQLNNKKNNIMNKEIDTNKAKQILDQNININLLKEEAKDKINEELFNLKKENNNLKKELKELKEVYYNEKSKNQQLSLKIKELDEIIKKEKEKENKFKGTNLINSKDKIIQLYEQLIKKEKEIKRIKSKFPFDLSENEELMSVIFFSPNQKIHHSIICKNTDQFTKIETKLYKEYPEYGNLENYFIVNGNKINKYKSLKDNNIKK